jgi:S1-C subfamily serine protease
VGVLVIYCSAVTALVAGLWWTSDQLDSPTVPDVAGSPLARATNTSLSGIRITDVTWSSLPGVHCQATPRGVAVNTVTAGSAAARGGLLPGDLILSMDGATTATVSDVSDVLELRDQGDRVKIRIGRAESTLVLVVTLG